MTKRVMILGSRRGAVLGTLVTTLIASAAAGQTTPPAGSAASMPALSPVVGEAPASAAAGAKSSWEVSADGAAVSPSAPAQQQAPGAPAARSEGGAPVIPMAPGDGGSKVEAAPPPAAGVPAPPSNPSQEQRYELPATESSSAGPVKTVFPWAAFLDVSPLWQRSKAYDLFDSHDLSWRVGVTVERDLVEVVKQSYLSVSLGWSKEDTSSFVLGSLDTELSVHNLTGGIRLRKDWIPPFSTYAAVSGGASRIRTLVGWGKDVIDWVPTVQLGGGISGQLSKLGKVQPGLLAEGGYYFSGATKLRINSDAKDYSTLEYETPELGTYKRSGPYLRFAAFLRY